MTTTTATAATALTPSAALDRLIPLLARARHGIMLDARSPAGFGHEQIGIQAGMMEVPLHLLELVRHNFEARAPLVSRVGLNGPLDELLMAFVLWRPASIFSRESGWRHAIPVEAQRAIAEALTRAPIPPCLFVDGGHELAALWPLDRPVDVRRGLGPAGKLLVTMAEVLGGDIDAARDPGNVTIPIGGRVRNWNATEPDPVRVFALTDRVHPFESLAEAFGVHGEEASK